VGEFWSTFIREVSAFGIAAGALAWLMNALVSHNLSKGLEAYRAQLSAATAVHIEQLRSAFAIATKEHEIRFGTLHSRRADALVKIGGALQTAAVHARLLVSIADVPGFAALDLDEESLVGQVQARSYSGAVMAMVELRQLVAANRLLLDAGLIKRLDDLVKALDPSWNTYMAHYSKKPRDPEQLRQALKAFGANLPEIDAHVAAVEADFRTILGSQNAELAMVEQPPLTPART
jgi:hypothetical protein